MRSLSKKKIELTADQSKKLKELSNIGSINAIHALSSLIGKDLEIPLSNVEILPFSEISEILEDTDSELLTAISDVRGKDNFSIIQVFSKSSIINVINILSEKKELKERKIKKIKDFDQFSLSIINEFSNILAGHYANALANIMGASIIPSVPELALQDCKALQANLINKYSEHLNNLMFINTNIIINELDFEGVMWFIPDLDSLEQLFKSIGIDYS